MAKKSKTDENIPDTSLPGVPLADFEAAIRVLKTLSDGGKYTIMLARTGAVRLVGAAEDFRQAFATEVNRDTAVSSVGKVLSEIRNFCQLRAFFAESSVAMNFLKENIYDDAFKELTAPLATAFEDCLAKKLELAISLLPTAYKQRQRRLLTATVACLEDVDAELVEKRHDDYQDIKVDQPFLRLRFRYVGANDELPCLMHGPWGGARSSPSKSFELECDEMDIDVLMFRLAEAKKMLVSAVKKLETETETGE
jgi:hypothetical protein